jgi:hypothetical protein
VRENERTLHPRTVKILTDAGVDYPLYRHQVETVRHASAGKTVVLSAGTGSGKTEAFLIPLIDRLFWDHELGLDDLKQPGIRAMIIYPLNALVNNQVERILDLLRAEERSHFRHITLAALRRTVVRPRKALPVPSVGAVPPDCQIIDRKSLRGLKGKAVCRRGPPHILVTNFSMLEYMLIRPARCTASFITSSTTNGRPRLRAIVLDEAHRVRWAPRPRRFICFSGAPHFRFGTRLEDIQGYATSATLGGDDEGDTLRKFAADMFSSPPDRVAPDHRASLPARRGQPDPRRPRSLCEPPS